MKRFDGWSAPRARRDFSRSAQFCEPLERRVLLSGDPVIVLTEAFSLTTFVDPPNPVTSQTVRPWLWENRQEYLWDLDVGDWDTNDGDGNGYPGDAYGWNFGGGGSPNIILNGPAGGHGAAIMGWVLNTLNGAGSQADRVRIMHVIGTGSEIVPYLLWHKAQGVNIVAVSSSTAEGSAFTRADAEDLRDEGILLFVGSSNSNTNVDPLLGTIDSRSFWHATPRFWIQEEPVGTIIPVTTNPQVHPTDYGINSFYFAAPNTEAQSYALPVAATYAAIAVQAYQDANNGASPTAEQVKRAMMSGVSYISGLDNRTITHDYVNGVRQDGGLLDLSKIITAINSTPSITDVSMTPGTPSGQTVLFNLNKTGATPTNWTISWGDNSGVDQSGVEVLDGELPSAEHTFPRDIQPHRYYPTIYAMLGTGNNRQVYLPAPSAQVEVLIDTQMGLTSGKDEYTLSLIEDDYLRVTLQNSNGFFSQTFAPGELPRTILELGEGGDTVTIDLTNGNPLDFTELTVRPTQGAGNVVRIIGSPGADTIENFCAGTTFVNGKVLRIRSPHAFPDVGMFIDGAGGDDVLSSSTARPTTLVGGDGHDTITITASNPTGVVVMAGEGDDILNVSGSAALARLSESETFSQINIGANSGLVVEEHGSLVVRTQSLSIASTGFLDLNDNRMIIDYTGSSPLATIQALLTSGYNDGDWDGNGIRSLTAGPAGNTAIGFAEATDLFTAFPATFSGQEVDDTAVLLRYTGYGDADLNGNVNLADFNKLAANFGQSDRRWVHGDFNFDGVVNLADFDRLAANFGMTFGPDAEDPGDFVQYTYEDLLDMLLGGGGS